MSLRCLLALAAALAVLCCAALAEVGILIPADVGLRGEVVWPEGADEAHAVYTLRYEYPQFDAQTAADEAINAYYQALARDMAQVASEMAPAYANAVDEHTLTQITCDVSHSSERYLSVVQTALEHGGSAEAETLSADTFARDGLYAGERLTLTQLLGLEQEGGELEDGASLAEALAYRLVWQLIEHDSQRTDSDYLDGLTEDGLRGAFSPEADFYLDEDGNVVFFIQAGVIAADVAGTLCFSFAPAELLSAAREQETT